MKKYKQLSLFDENDEPIVKDVLIDFVSCMKVFDTEKDFKENVDNILSDILKIYSNYNQNVEYLVQLEIAGKLNLLAKNGSLKEDGYTKNVLEPKTLDDLNNIIKGIILQTQNILDTSRAPMKDTIFNLVEQYVYVLSAYKNYIGSANE